MPRKFKITSSGAGGGEGRIPPPKDIIGPRPRGGFGEPPPPPPGIPPIGGGPEMTPNRNDYRSPVTPPLVSSRYAGATRANPTVYIGNATTGSNWPAGGDDQADDGLGWVQIGPIDRPTVLIPTEVTNARILYYPIDPPSQDSYAFSAFGDGVVFLWSPGVWWVKVDQDNEAVGFVQVPMDDPAAASLFAARAGAMNRSDTTNDSGTSRVAFTSKGVAADLVGGANVRRRAFILTIGVATDSATSTAADLHFGIILTKDGAGPANANDCHFILNANSALELSGDTNWKGDIRGIILTSSDADTVDVYGVEFE